MKRNRSKYYVWDLTKQCGFEEANSKWQMKKMMRKMGKAESIKVRLTNYRDGSFGFWNEDRTYDNWTFD